MHIFEAIMDANANDQRLLPQIGASKQYKHWISENDERRCKDCKGNHGKIWKKEEPAEPAPPLHPRCRCTIETMATIAAGTATINGFEGADWVLKEEGTLPDYYISKQDAEKQRWKAGKWPSNFVPGKMIAGGIYRNSDGHLPDAPGRTWQEADMNYETGKRNTQRILWSNDGLIFVTYDHYETFYEIVDKEDFHENN